MPRWTVPVGLLAALTLATESPAAPADPATVEFFEAAVRPILVERCVGCHGPEKQKAGLRLDSLAAALRGGDSGPAVEPGKPEESLLLEVVRYHDEPRMPPKGKLADAEIGALDAWVRAGAVWPEDPADARRVEGPSGFQVRPEDREFWAFRPVADPAPPAVHDEAWLSNDLDRFILARLEAEGLRPVEPADRRVLIRRVSFGLIGLPPTPEEVDAFLSDESPDAFEKVVDRLLASPHYGERWGRHWLDVARYGEDQAHTFQARVFPHGYRYRDWVVKALNQDMPYDRFIVEQVAGDLLDGPGRDDRLAATGLFALGPHYYGNAVADELDDRVDTLTRGFLGLTVACARCHDHKYDPIGTKDYYALAGVFASTKYEEAPAAPAEVVEAYDRAQAAIKAQDDAIKAFVKAEAARWSEAAAEADTAKAMIAAWTLLNRRKADPEASSEAVAKEAGIEPFLLDRWFKFLSPDEKDGRPDLAAWRKVVGGQDASTDLSADAAARAEVEAVARDYQVYVASAVGLVRSRRAYDEAAKAVGAGAAETPSGVVEVFDKVASPNGLFGLHQREAERQLAAEVKAELRSMRAELDRLKMASPPKYPVIHAIADASKPADLRVHIRGNPENLGEEAPRAFLSILCDGSPEPFGHGSGRLELARAIASPDNPLTARVLVNRTWEHHFGRGLVGTPSNFGNLGDRPTHPELLDWLARRFVEGGWSIKDLHRTILLSSTYRLASAHDSANHEVDPENRLLWRASRRRLEVEPWRDAILAVAGTLDPTLGGPSLDLDKADNNRRTFYGAVSRHRLDGLLRLFDFPDPNITSDRRPVTIVPLQQLFALNSEFLQRQAEALAGRLRAGEGDDEARVRRAFPLLFARPATDREVALGLAYLASAGQETDPEGAWARYAQVLLCTNEFAFID